MALRFTLGLDVFPDGPLEVPDVAIEPCRCPASSTLGACLINPAASMIAVTRAPYRAMLDQPLEMELAAPLRHHESRTAVSLARHISSRARVKLDVEINGEARVIYAPFICICTARRGWVARVLVSPAAWVSAASVTLMSCDLAGQPLPCVCLPVTLQVGFNHSRVPAGSVHAAARAGDLRALLAALYAGGSTEETDAVRERGGKKWERESRVIDSKLTPVTFSSAVWQHCPHLGRLQQAYQSPPRSSGSGSRRSRHKQCEVNSVRLGSRKHIVARMPDPSREGRQL